MFKKTPIISYKLLKKKSFESNFCCLSHWVTEWYDKD